MVWLGTTDALIDGLPCGQGGMILHVVGAGLDSDRVVDDALHYRARGITA